MKKNKSKIPLVLADFRSGQYSNMEIAKRYGLTNATVSSWLRKAGIPLCKRGARRLKSPRPFHCKVVAASKHQRPSEIARQLGVSRQYIHQILKKWGQHQQAAPQTLQTPETELSTRTGREVRSCVVSFRLTEKEAAMLVAKCGAPEATWCRAAHSLVTQVLHGSASPMQEPKTTGTGQFHVVKE